MILTTFDLQFLRNILLHTIQYIGIYTVQCCAHLLIFDKSRSSFRKLVGGKISCNLKRNLKFKMQCYFN